MNRKYLRRVKKLIKSAWKFKYCRVKAYIEPSISSVVFFIDVDGYNHIFKAPFGLIESNLCVETLAYIIVDEILEWRKNMKKLYVSVPMKGRTVEEIKATIQKMKKLAEKI